MALCRDGVAASAAPPVKGRNNMSNNPSGGTPPGVRPRRSAVTGKPLAMPYGFQVLAEESDVAAARRRIVQTVRSWEVPLPEGAFDDLALLSSEVITNAVRYTRAPCAVAVRWTGVRVRVEVTDTDPVRPQLRESPLDAEGGRGLLLIEAVAAAWGSRAHPAGKVIWFEVGPPDTVVPVGVRRLVGEIRAALPITSSARRRGLSRATVAETGR